MKQYLVGALAGVLLTGTVGVAAGQVRVPGAFLASRIEARQQAFVASLGLNASQQAAWQNLHQQQTRFAADARQALASLVGDAKADLANPAADLHATQARGETQVDHLLAEHRTLKHAQLAFYDQLNVEQQQRVRQQLLERISKMERIRDDLLDVAAAAQ